MNGNGTSKITLSNHFSVTVQIATIMNNNEYTNESKRDKEEEKRSRVIDELCHKVVFFSIDRVRI